MPPEGKLRVFATVVKSLVHVGQIVFVQHFDTESVFLNENGSSLKNGFGNDGLIPLSFIGGKIE